MLSDLHAMLATVKRDFSARRINEIANHPDVLPFVKGATQPPVDLTPAVRNKGNVVLVGAHGAIFFHQIQLGLYEGHSMCLPEGRGHWMASFARAAMHFMFTRTDCLEIIGRCPNPKVKALVRHLGWTKEFVNPNGWMIEGKFASADIYAIRLQDWLKTAPGLVERGLWFYDHLNTELARHKRKPVVYGTEMDCRMAGLAVEMCFYGQTDKATIFYHRYAVLADRQPFRLLAREPVALDIDGVIIIIPEPDDFYIASVPEQAAVH